MKKLFCTAAAFALVASSAAFAEPAPKPTDGPFGGDGISNVYIGSNATLFCQLGQLSNQTGSNASLNSSNAAIQGADGNPHDGRSGATSDGVVTFTVQDGGNDSLDAGSIGVNYPGSICNAVYNVKVSSANAGMTFQGTVPGGTDPAFLTTIPYTVGVSFDGHTSSTTQASSLGGAGHDLLSNEPPSVGLFTVNLAVSANPNNFLLQGNYQDNILVTMAPGV